MRKTKRIEVTLESFEKISIRSESPVFNFCCTSCRNKFERTQISESVFGMNFSGKEDVYLFPANSGLYFYIETAEKD